MSIRVRNMNTMTKSTESLLSVGGKPYTPNGGQNSIWSRGNKNSIGAYGESTSNSKKVSPTRYRTLDSTDKK